MHHKPIIPFVIESSDTMKVISVAVDDETHRLTRIKAAQKGTSMSALLREYPLGYRRTHHTARQLQGEPEGAQEGGGGVRVDEDGGRITEDKIPGSRADGAGWVLRGYGLQSGEDGEPGIV